MHTFIYISQAPHHTTQSRSNLHSAPEAAVLFTNEYNKPLQNYTQEVVKTWKSMQASMNMCVLKLQLLQNYAQEVVYKSAQKAYMLV